MKTNKKAQMFIGIIGVVIIGLIILFLVSKSVIGSGSLDSLTPKEQGCNPKDISVRINGDANVKDTAIFGVVAEAESITINEVRSITTGEKLLSFQGEQLRGFTTEDYDWKVSLINTRTNNEEAKDTGSNTHEGSGQIQSNPYILDFNVPDNNCDNKIDDFDAKIELKVLTEDNKETKKSKLIEFRNGKFQAK